MKKVSIEAGGKSAFIIFDDADLEQAAKWAIAGRWTTLDRSAV